MGYPSFCNQVKKNAVWFRCLSEEFILFLIRNVMGHRVLKSMIFWLLFHQGKRSSPRGLSDALQGGLSFSPLMRKRNKRIKSDRLSPRSESIRYFYKSKAFMQRQKQAPFMKYSRIVSFTPSLALNVWRAIALRNAVSIKVCWLSKKRLLRVVCVWPQQRRWGTHHFAIR